MVRGRSRGYWLSTSYKNDITAIYWLDRSPLDAARHTNAGVKLPNRLYSRRNNKLPQAVAKAIDNIWERPIPTFKE